MLKPFMCRPRDHEASVGVWQLFHENWLLDLEEPMGERRAQLLFLKDALNAIDSL